MESGPLIAVTGATGYVGHAVIRQALAEGYRVRAIVREPAAAQSLARAGVEMFHGNVLYAPSLEGAFIGVKCVIHLVGIINEWKENTFERAHTQATIHVVDAAKKAGARRYIHMSALGVRPDARSRYHQTKWAAEEYVRKSGTNWTIFRPSIIYGAEDISTTVLAKIVRRSPFIPVIGNGRTKIQPVSIEVVARCFVGAIKLDSTMQKTYDLCGPEAFTWNELYDKLADVYGVRKPKLHLPLPVARLQGAVLEKISPKPPFNREQVIMAQEDNAGDPRPAEHDFSITQESFEQGVARYLKPS